MNTILNKIRRCLSEEHGICEHAKYDSHITLGQNHQHAQQFNFSCSEKYIQNTCKQNTHQSQTYSYHI
jgi:hypothetical protein